MDETPVHAPDDGALLDLLPDGVVVADGSGTVLRVNAVAARMLAVDADSSAGRQLDEVLRLVDSRGCSWVATNTPWTGLPSRSGVPEQSWSLPSGAEVLVDASLHREHRGGPVQRVVVCLRDGRWRARLDRERSDLVATVAHELRSPLTGVKGFVQVLLNRWDQLADEQRKLMLTTVSADADRLSRLIAELLDVARIDTGRLSYYPRPVDPVVLAERVLASVGAATARPLRLDATSPVPEVLADPDKFTQVITNLVENGVLHGEGTVTVALAGDATGEHVVVEVGDEGTGIPAEMRKRVFTKFWTQGGSSGSGLGMYIVDGLARAHGASVEIDDAPTGGALVRVRWPVATE